MILNVAKTILLNVIALSPIALCGCDSIKSLIDRDRNSMVRSSNDNAARTPADIVSAPTTYSSSGLVETDPWGDGYGFGSSTAPPPDNRVGGYDSLAGNNPPPSYPSSLPPSSPQLPPSFGSGSSGSSLSPVNPFSGDGNSRNLEPPSSPRSNPPSSKGQVLAADLTDLSGSWELVRTVRDSKEQFPEAKERFYRFSSDNWYQVLNPDEKMSFKLNPAEEPKRIELESTTGTLRFGIYKIENNKLIICYNNGGLRRPKSFEPELNKEMIQLEFQRISE